MEVSISNATVKDIKQLAQFHVASWRDAYASILSAEYLDNLSAETRSKEWQTAVSEIAAGKKIKNILLAKNACGKIIGFCSAAQKPGTDFDCELETLYVAPNYQRQGIGKALLAATVQWLRGNKGTLLACWVFAEHAKSREFYESIGGALRTESLELEFGDEKHKIVSYRWILGQLEQKLAIKLPA